MLRNVKDLQGYAIRATDGLIGKVDDFYFDDEAWTVRYLVVDTGDWLSGRKVLISPIAFGHTDWLARTFSVSLTQEQVRNSPDIDTRKPVSRQHEANYLEYYGYPDYWSGAGLWGMGSYPGSLTAQDRIEAELKAHGTRATQPPDDCHLRSSRAITGYHIHASDGDIGHVTDLLVDDHSWAIRYLIANTSNWWGGHHVLIAPAWIAGVSWAAAHVSVGVSREVVKHAPPYDADAELDRQQEEAIFEHYGHPGYWTATSMEAKVQLSPDGPTIARYL
jgi:uncharacterized protein YrrD